MSSTDYHLPLGIGHAEILPIGVLTSARTGINICLRNYQEAYVVCRTMHGAHTSAEVFTFAQSSAAAGSAGGIGEKALTNNIEDWWYCNDCGLTQDGGQDVNWTAGTAAKAWTTDTAQSKSKIAIFHIIPEQVLDSANGFDCITVNTTGSNSAHYGEVYAILLPRYKPPLSVTIDNSADVSYSPSASASASASAS